MNDQITRKEQPKLPPGLVSPEEIDVTELVTNSPVLARIIEEVRNEQVAEHYAYNRMHNRHNRSR